MENILISACLLGVNCKYNGGNNYCPKTEKLKEKFNLIPVCPECDGGLPTPRDPSEIVGNKVLSNKGNDVTAEFNRGAQIALQKAISNSCTAAVLKHRSPSCGSTEIYDGTFSGKTVKSSGITAALLRKNGIKLYNENDIDFLINGK